MGSGPRGTGNGGEARGECGFRMVGGQGPPARGVTREAAAEAAGPAKHGIYQPGCDCFAATVLGPASFLVFVFGLNTVAQFHIIINHFNRYIIFPQRMRHPLLKYKEERE